MPAMARKQYSENIAIQNAGFFWLFMFFKNQRIPEPPFYRPTGGEILQ